MDSGFATLREAVRQDGFVDRQLRAVARSPGMTLTGPTPSPGSTPENQNYSGVGEDNGRCIGRSVGDGDIERPVVI